MNILDSLGWGGAFGLLLFYWLMGSQKIMPAYIAGTFGGACWFVVGCVTTFSNTVVSLPSLMIMEAMVITLNIRAMWNWRKKQVTDKTDNATETPVRGERKIACMVDDDSMADPSKFDKFAAGFSPLHGPQSQYPSAWEKFLKECCPVWETLTRADQKRLISRFHRNTTGPITNPATGKHATAEDVVACLKGEL